MMCSLLTAAAMLLFGFLIYKAFVVPTQKARPDKPTERENDYYAERMMAIEKKAEQMNATHMIETPHGVETEAVWVDGHFVTKTQPCHLIPTESWNFKVTKVLTEQPHKAELMDLFGKMLKATNTKARKSYAGMGSVWWSIGLVDRFGGEGPALRIMGTHSRELALDPNGPMVELTSDEAINFKNIIEARENPVTTVKTVEELLDV